MVILFDLDGTLIDSTEAILESFHNSFKVFNEIQRDDKDIKALIGYPLDVMYAKLGIDEKYVWDFVAVYKEYYREISTKKTVLLPNAKEAVIEASKFATLGIVTTKTGRYSKILMEHFGIMDYFKVLVGREDVQNPKPHKEPIISAINRLDVYDKDIWIIGDTKLDLISAQNAGIGSVAVLSGYDSKDVLQKYTQYICKDAKEAVNFLKNRKK